MDSNRGLLSSQVTPSYYPFSGNYNGDGYIISNLKVDQTFSGTTSTNKAYGLFGYLTGTVKNVGLTNLDVSVSNTQSSSTSGTTNAYAGGIAAYVGASGTNGYIYNSYVEGTVYARTAYSSSRCAAGGLAGYLSYGTISNSYAAATVSIGGSYGSSSGAGGVAGYKDSNGSFSNSYWDTTLTTTGSSSTSGITGKTTAGMKDSAFVTLLNTNRSTYNEWMSDTPGLNSGYPIHKRIIEPIIIGNVAVTEIDVPVTGETPDTSANVTTAGVESPVSVTWSPTVAAAFGGNMVYTATVTLTPSGSNIFAPGVTATVDGNTASSVILNENGTLTVTYRFPRTAVTTSKTYELASSVTSGSSYVIVYKTSSTATTGYALTTEAVSGSSTQLIGVSVTTSGNYITSSIDSGTEVWEFTTHSSGTGYNVMNGDNYLNRKSGGGVYVSTTSGGTGYANWQYNSSSQMFTYNNSQNNYLYQTSSSSTYYFSTTTST
jgi:hypothetical protein